MAEKVPEKLRYKNPYTSGQPLLVTISSNCKTPMMKVKFCNLVKPYYYANSPKIARYSVTCVIDPDENIEFIEGIQSIEKNERVPSIIKQETEKRSSEYVTSGNVILKFQTKDIVPIFIKDEKGEQQIELIDDLAAGENVSIIYDILRYTKKSSQGSEHGLSFKLTKVYYYPS